MKGAWKLVHGILYRTTTGHSKVPEREVTEHLRLISTLIRVSGLKRKGWKAIIDSSDVLERGRSDGRWEIRIKEVDQNSIVFGVQTTTAKRLLFRVTPPLKALEINMDELIARLHDNLQKAAREAQGLVEEKRKLQEKRENPLSNALEAVRTVLFSPGSSFAWHEQQQVTSECQRLGIYSRLAEQAEVLLVRKGEVQSLRTVDGQLLLRLKPEAAAKKPKPIKTLGHLARAVDTAKKQLKQFEELLDLQTRYERNQKELTELSLMIHQLEQTLEFLTQNRRELVLEEIRLTQELESPEIKKLVAGYRRYRREALEPLQRLLQVIGTQENQ